LLHAIETGIISGLLDLGRGCGVYFPNSLVGDGWPTSQNPYPIYDQNLLPFLTYDLTEKSIAYFMTVAAYTVAVNIVKKGFC